MAQNSQTRQLQAILEAYTYCTSAFVPTKTLTVRKIHGYNHIWKLAKLNFGYLLLLLLLLLLQLNWPTIKVAQVLTMVFTQNGSFL